MSNEVTGTISLLEEAKEYGNNGFRKRLMVLVQNLGRYENFIPLEFIADNCESANNLQEGMEVTVTYNLKGRKWTSPETGEDKYFLSAEVDSFKCMELDNLDQEVAVQATSSNSDESSTEDIPF